MKVHRFFGNFDIQKSSLRIDDRNVIHQLDNVLRIKPGEHIALFDDSGYEAEYEIVDMDKTSIELSRLSYEKNEAEPAHSVTIFLSILKKENFELAVQKAVEAGVTEIVPTITERTVKIGIDEARLSRILKEAAEQSGRGIVPKLHPVLPFAEALTYASSLGFGGTLFDSSGSPLFADSSQLKAVSYFIGPEGGFAPSEVSAARDAGFTIASLGPRTLRAETAAIIATFLLAK